MSRHDNRRRNDGFALWGFLFIFVFVWTKAVIAEHPSGLRRIFIVHSYEQDHVCGQPQHDGVLKALRDAGFEPGINLEVRTFYMDTYRTNNTPELIEKVGREALDEVKASAPDVVVTLDDNAFRTVGLALNGTSTPVVFSGMNGFPEDYDAQRDFMHSRSHPGGNITGVHEKLHVIDALRVHTRLFPKTQKVLFITDTSSTGRGIWKQIATELAQEAAPCDWEIRVAHSWENYKAIIREANADPQVSALYPAALVLVDKQGLAHTAPEIFPWTARHSRKPEIAVNFDFVQMGLFGGAAVDFFAMGEKAGRMVAAILEGTPPGDVPIEEADRIALGFNLRRAKRLGIHIPEDVLLAADYVHESRLTNP
ncbi:ABC transporter substrate-binding protein [Desulfosoma caldarium]|uniref:ABC-type uncharacterized transport system substrate-binding protein n=1 Tax=Desulfosoma caldarium TaxID=610254 RepID=A0A3N1VFS8_9BACT|nr:ABC transporter substrate binding protein [Desulfosoma caldarium]ROR01694.1 ABC-type uncharacterized transport system substrate-binding protein [Desulfosoma caldarium]